VSVVEYNGIEVIVRGWTYVKGQ